MEALILIHSNQRIFWRDNLPSKPYQYSNSYERATAVSEMIAQRNADEQPIIRPGRMTGRGIAPVSVVSEQYRKKFCWYTESLLLELPDVEKVLDSTAQNEIDQSLAGFRKLEDHKPIQKSTADISNSAMATYKLPAANSDRFLTTQFQKTHSLTRIQFLDALSTRISQESYTLNFDYFTFHTRCMRLLKAIYEDFEDEIKDLDGELDWGRGELPLVPHWLFAFLEDDKKRANTVERLRRVMQPSWKLKGRGDINLERVSGKPQGR
jgi:hypothetical protein